METSEQRKAAVFPLTCRVYLYTGALGLAMALCSVGLSFVSGHVSLRQVYEIPGSALLFSVVFALPLVVTCVNLLSLKEGLVSAACQRVNWVLTVVAGAFDSYAYAAFCNMTSLPWDVQLYNTQLHEPIWGEALPTVTALVGVGILGFVVLACFRLDRLSPIVIVACISSLYVASAVLLTFSVQVLAQAPLLALPPLNCIVMAAALVGQKVREWNENPEHCADRYDADGLVGRLNARLADSASWSWWALAFALPLLGVVLAVLALIGQRPDYVVRAWTETADWTLSTKEAPVNLVADEHYLCTVAASGHEELVKPLRYGERHGHRIVVNRQLLVANAFENVLRRRRRASIGWCAAHTTGTAFPWRTSSGTAALPAT